uniref:NADH:ubiquinone reductase (non-electrogenic) n=1 Tax=Thermosporothrix sp. COM3 TaxID=2490863 RepID=A0A455SBJ1_9CHLR|nr:NADH dehydrogenase [Thermosporothrix sp. COM3]
MKQTQETASSLSSRPRVVIVGAGFGGLRAAQKLGNAPVQVTVIDRTNHHLFQPLLYQVATATLSPGEITAPVRHVLKRQRNTQVIMAEVTGVDTQKKQVLMGDQTIPYDYLILATGARENYFGHEEWRKYAPGLKTIEDARAIRHKLLLAFEAAELETDPERVRELLTFIVVGAGPTGIEMAGAIAEVAHKVLKSEFRNIDPSMARVILLEMAPRVLPVFPEALSHKAKQALVKLGVEVRTNTAVSLIDENGVIAGGERINASTILWTAGVKASPAASWLGVEADRAGRVVVEPDLSVKDLPDVFVIGDTASCVLDGKPVPGLAPAALQQGSYVADLITRRVEGKPAPAPFKYFDKGSMATIGRGSAVALFKGLKLSGPVAWLMWLAVHLVYLIGFANRLLVMMQWARAYLSSRRGVRLITVFAQDGLLKGPKTPPSEQEKEKKASAA